MESVDKTTTVTTTTKWFTFTKEEAEVLAAVLMDKVDWEQYEYGQFEKFFNDFYNDLADVRYGS